jgi:Zn-finger nucleic acid-binding protein
MVKTDKNLDSKKDKYFFFLNTRDDQGFTRCPECNNKTGIKKIVLVIVIKAQNPLMLGKKCKFCPKCELIIVKKSEIENLLCHSMEEVNRPDLIGADYDVIGTIDKKYAIKKDLSEMSFFNDIWDFKIEPAHWVKD